jgi:two-component system sensor histidine kinase AlgZ
MADGTLAQACAGCSVQPTGVPIAGASGGDAGSGRLLGWFSKGSEAGMGVRREAGNPLDALWQPPVLVWAIVVVLGLALVLALVPGPATGSVAAVFERFGLVAFFGAWIVLLALGGLYALRRGIARRDPMQVGWIGVGMLLLATWIVCVAIHLVAGRSMEGMSLGQFLARASAVSLTVGLISLGAFQTVWRNMQLRALARRSELAALQARVNPHFLFNTLNTAISLLRQRPDLAETLLHDLSDLFRAALSAARPIALAEELQLCRRYLEIESLRLGARLQVHWREPDALPEMEVPALLVQPLVENAVRHGIEPAPAGGAITIEVRVAPEAVTIEVVNPLPPATSPPVRGHRVGQDAVRSRLEAATRGEGALDIRTEAGHYHARLRIPRHAKV